MKFVNLHTGNVFDGSQPYIHWFEGQQSTDLIYIQPICFISPIQAKRVTCSSDVFSIINVDVLLRGADIDINSFKYKNFNSCKVESYVFNPPINDPTHQTYQITEEGPYKGQYLYMFYIAASSSTAAEYVDGFTIDTIDGEEIFFVGADFYQENESLKINASNMGVNIPPQIQGAVYGSNVHEEKHDNILINRKFKELISNYWDLIANRGSYKSLIDTLKWFEYGDAIRLREVWKHNRDGNKIYDDRELSSIMNDKYKTSLNKFFKTTYFAIWCALQKETGRLTAELNPELEARVFKWSVEDMSLKMSLLGNFYETYFMPIHTELIQASIEDVVYTNTIKINSRTLDSLSDLMNLSGTFRCTINDNKEVIIGDVSVGVDDSTVFGIKYGSRLLGDSYNTVPVGVKPIEEIDVIYNDNELKTLLSQNYNGPGAVVPIECSFDLGTDEVLTYGDLIITSIDVYGNKYERYTQESNFIGKIDEDGTLRFNILLLYDYNTVRLSFMSSRGRHYSKTVEIPMKDISNVVLGLYKVKRNHYSTIKLRDFGDPTNLFTLSRIKIPSNTNGLTKYSQYISYHIPESSKEPKDGVGLNHIVALNSGWEKVVDVKCNKILDQYYIKLTKGTKNKKTIFISNFFIDSIPAKLQSDMEPVEPDMHVLKSSMIENSTTPGGSVEIEFPTIKSDLDYLWDKLKGYIYFYRSIYFPELHHLEPFGSFADSNSSLSDFTVSQYDTLFVTPSLMLPGYDKDGYSIWVTYLYGKDIENASWEFRNRSLNESYIIESSVLEPNILPTSNEELKDGYYDVIFRYRLKTDKESEHELVLNSAFLKKHI